MRPILVWLHRYTGLGLAVFLAIAGLTGSIIAFNGELDTLFNPELFRVASRGPALSADALAARVERQLPNTRVTLIPFMLDAGEAAELRVEPIKGTLSYDEAFADPVTGAVLGTRQWGAFAFSRAALIPFLYLLHYSLSLPGAWGIFIMGIASAVWAIDCFVGFILTLPRGGWRKWLVAWRIKKGAGRYRFYLDMHRAGGLWLWAVLFIVATSGVALNLPDQVFRPIVSIFAKLSPSILESAKPRAKPLPPLLSFGDALTRGQQEARRRHLPTTPTTIFRYSSYGAYGIGFAHSKDGLGPSYIYVDDRDGRIVARQIAGDGTAGDIYVAAQFQLHSGRILGLAGRILVSIGGLVVTLLSLTGIYLWYRKRAGRLALARRHSAGAETARTASPRRTYAAPAESSTTAPPNVTASATPIFPAT